MLSARARNAISGIAFTAVVAACLPATAAAVERCPSAAGRVYVTYAPREPYQLSRYRLADDSQYRLADDSQYRLNGASGCPRRPPEAAAAAKGSGARTLVITPAYAPAGGRGVYHALINATAKAANIQADLLHAVVAVESAYNSQAVSPKGAQGLMQLMPATARLYTVGNPYDPAQNLKAGARHLRYLLGEFDNDLALALAAYNAGAEAVRRYSNSIPPYPETRDYVERVLRLYTRRLDSAATTGN